MDLPPDPPQIAIFKILIEIKLLSGGYVTASAFRKATTN
jgi:hypothetical protein